MGEWLDVGDDKFLPPQVFVARQRGTAVHRRRNTYVYVMKWCSKM
jgi:hypothetical protein